MRAEAVVLANASLVDLDGKGPGRLVDIRIEGERIVAVGEAAAPGGEARVIDLQGCAVMAGMFSCHFHTSNTTTHASAGQQRTLPIGMDAPPIFQGLRAARTLALALESGITGVVSAGGAPFAIDASLKMAVEAGLIPGPRMMAGSRDVSSTGHSADLPFPWHWDGDNPAALLCDGPDSFRRGVRSEIKRGAEIIKIFASAGHGVDGVMNKLELTQDEMNAAAEAAHQRGAKIRVHAANHQSVVAALDAGFDLIDHGDGLDEACIERMVDKGVFLAPSMLFPHRYVSQRQDALASVMREELAAMLKMLPIANAAGVKIVLGDDFGSPKMPHGEYAEELDYYVNVVGIPARDVLRWATTHGAELFGRGHELGALRPGHLADLIVVDGDPLADVRVLKDKSRLLAVMKGGVFFKDELARLTSIGRAGPAAAQRASRR